MEQIKKMRMPVINIGYSTRHKRNRRNHKMRIQRRK
jgi:hypothetical protein